MMNILVTGANRGLGLSLTKVGLENGHSLFAGVRSTKEEATKQLRELQKMYHEKLTIIQLDVVQEDSVNKAAHKIADITNSLDCVINNAGMLNARNHKIEELDIDDCMTAFDVNTLGPIRVIKHFLPLLAKGQQQSIINISSDSASLTNAYFHDYPYGLSKVALNMLSEKLNVYLRDQDIQILSVHPGWIKTDMGGDQAPTNPVDSAKGIFKMIHREKIIESPHVFVDYQGKPMEI